MSKKKKILIIVAIVCVVLLIGGVIAWWLLHERSVEEKIARAENTYETDYHSYCTYEHDPDIDIDGVLEESVWQGKQWYTTTYPSNLNGNLPKIKVTGFTTEKGIYIASVAEDTDLRYNGELAPGANSNWEFAVTADNVGQERSASSLYSVSFNIDMKGACFGTRTNFDRAVKVEGELNSGATTSATLEMFIPWEIMMIDTSLGIPDTFRMLPSYRGVLSGQSETVRIETLNAAGNTTDYYVFNQNGYRDVDREGAVLGDTVVGWPKSGNWDISREAEGIVESSTGTEYHQIFFTGKYGRDFILETNISYVKSLDNWFPKAGFVFKGTDAIWYSVWLDLRGELVSDNGRGTHNVNQLLITTVNQAWEWNYMWNYSRPNTADVKDEVKLTVLKYGSRFYYFINDAYYTSEDISYMGGEVFPGIFSLGCDAIYKDSSCKELTEDTLKEYLNGKGVYTVEASVASAGGFVSASKGGVQKGESYEISMTSNPGYEVSSVLVNGKECIEDARKNAEGGVYTIRNVTENQEVQVFFAACDGVTLSGTLTDGEYNVMGKVAVRGKSNGTLAYEVSGSGSYSIVLPNGRYEVTASASDYKNTVFTIDVKGDTVKNISMAKSDFPASLEVNGATVQSGREVWNLEKEHEKKVSTSYAAGGKMRPLYFNSTAKDFVVQSTIEYTTEFTGDASSYQPDLMGGFIFDSGGKNGWIVVNKNHLIYTDFQWLGGIYAYELLAYPTKRSVTVTLVKSGNDVFVYYDGKLIHQMEWSVMTNGIGPEEEVAIGLFMVADKTADICFSNYSLQRGAEAAKNYINSHGNKDVSLADNPIFAESVVVNGQKLMSQVERWDISQLANGVTSTSYAAGGKMAPLYFAAHGSTVLMHATIEYTTNFTGPESEYQPDLFGGFVVNDGFHNGFVMANSTGVVTGDWKWRMGMIKDSLLRYPDKRTADFTVALQDKYFYIYFDGKFASKLPISWVVPGASAGSDMAFGLYMLADKTADIRFSNISVSTDVNEVDAYIQQHR